MKNSIKILACSSILASALLLSACASGDKKVMTEMSFDHIKPYPLYIASYEVFTTPATDNVKIPEGFVANPVDIARKYFTNRFEETGTQGKLSVVLDQAIIGHKMEQSKSSIGAFMGVDRYDVYEISMVIKLILFGVKGYEKQENIIRVNRMVSISEHVSMAERERLQMQALDALLDDVDVGVRNILDRDLGVMH